MLGLLVGALALSGAWAQGAQAAYDLKVSKSSNRSSAVTLGGQTYTKSTVIYVFVSPATSVKTVTYYLDGALRRVEKSAPYDFNNTSSSGAAIGFSLSSLSTGTHTIKATVNTQGGNTQQISKTFTVSGGTTPPPPPPPPPPPAPPPPPPSGSGLRFADEFNGTKLDTTKWNAWSGPGFRDYGLRSASALTVSGGSLVVTAKMVSGKIVTGGMSHKSDYKYGRYEFRVKTEKDSTSTMSGIVMTWPKTQWSPEFTENDIYETGPSGARSYFNTFIHYGYSYSTQKYYRHSVDASQWHTVTMDWRASSLKIYRDGVLRYTVTDRAAIPDVLHHLNIQLDTRANRTLKAPVRMWVDYVRIYS